MGPCESVVFEDEKSEECQVAPLKESIVSVRQLSTREKRIGV